MNRKYILISIIIVVLLAGFAAIKLRSSKQPDSIEPTPSPTVVLPTVSADIKVELTPKNGNREIRLKISGITADITSIEYELTYMTGAGLTKGVLGKITLKEGEREVERDEVLGTCSSGRCVYDTGVTSVDLTLKFNTESGASVFQKTYSF